MQNILLPSKMSFSEGEKQFEAILTIEPLHMGYGTTVGNALRRVLLSSLEGAAVTAVKIKGVQHELSAIEGVKEDVLDITLNLKQLRMKVHSDEPVILKLESSGSATEVTASDISPNADVEIINSDLVIATLTDKSANLQMEITVSRGRGFVPTEEQMDGTRDIGVMAVDALFSPVVNVGLKVENTRVGEITNYDKLVMSITTDGTITPQDAVAQATKLIISHFNWIDGQLTHGSLEPDVEVEEAPEEVAELEEVEELAGATEEAEAEIAETEEE
ncbi:MAG: DNA-directed RNA polymerase subunit alpha [bacterium]